MKKIIVFLSAITLFVACSNNEECRQQLYVVVGADMKQAVFDEVKGDNVKEDFIADSITIFGLGRDSLLYDNVPQIKTFDLPLQKTKEETHFVLRFREEDDTLSFKHTNDTNYISMACGCIIQATITDIAVTNNNIDSVVLKEPLVINSRVANIEIYFKNN